MTATLELIDKARRLLIEGRLNITLRDGDVIRATCRGDSGELYNLGYNPAMRGWDCSCAARSTCAHLRALMLVTVRRG